MKGQYFSFDAIIASVIFILALVALLSYWHSVKSFLDFQGDSMSRDAIRVSNLLFTPSSPPATCVGTQQLGFALSWDDRRVNSSMLECAAGYSQSDLRQVFGVPQPDGISLKVTNIDDSSAPQILIGGPVPSSVVNVVKITRLATVVNSTSGATNLASFELSLYTVQ